MNEENKTTKEDEWLHYGHGPLKVPAQGKQMHDVRVTPGTHAGHPLRTGFFGVAEMLQYDLRRGSEIARLNDLGPLSESPETLETLETRILKFATEQWGEKTMERLVNKLAEEAGEVAGAVVKSGEGRATQQDLEDELGDVLIVLSQFAAKLDTTLEGLLVKRLRAVQYRAKRKANTPTNK